MQIWDTAGQERFKTITQTYYRGAMGIVLTYACNDMDSFNNVDSWMSQIKTHASHEVQMILVANKSDMPDRAVSTEQGQELASKYGIPFFETSAKEDINVNDAFHKIADLIVTRITTNPSSNGQQPGIKQKPNQTESAIDSGNAKLKNQKKPEEKKGCC